MSFLHILPRLPFHSFDVLAPTLRSRGASQAQARHLSADAAIYSDKHALFSGDPAGRLVIPTLPRVSERPMAVWTPEQARVFWEGTRELGERYHALYALALATGMREGELLALRWRDVDLDKRPPQYPVLLVRATLSRVGGQLVFGEPKTKGSRRQIRLAPAPVAALLEHRKRQLEERLRAGPAWEEQPGGGLVFTNEIGGPLRASHACDYCFHRARTRLGLPRIRFHDLRHTAATLQLLKGVNVKVVSEMLGHSSITMTLTKYAHVLPDMQAASVEAVQVLFG